MAAVYPGMPAGMKAMQGMPTMMPGMIPGMAQMIPGMAHVAPGTVPPGMEGMAQMGLMAWPGWAMAPAGMGVAPGQAVAQEADRGQGQGMHHQGDRMGYGGERSHPTTPTSNLFVGGLPREMLEPELREMFAPYGNVVSTKVILDLVTGRSKGSGFVLFSSADEATAAVKALNGLNGMTVKYADDRGKGKGKGKGEIIVSKDNLYITGLPGPDLQQTELKGMFEELGIAVVRCKVFPNTRGTPTCTGMVQVATPEMAQTAIAQLNGKGKVSVQFAVERVPDASGIVVAIRYASADRNSIGEQPPSDNLFISGLPAPTVDQNQLLGLFTSLGATVVRSRMLPDTRGKGYSAAMVQLASKEEAAAAIAAFHGMHPNSLGLDPIQAPPGFEEQPQGEPPQHNNLFVGNIGPHMTEAELREIFEKFGTIDACRVSVDMATGKSKGSGFVRFATQEEAKNAMEALAGQNGMVVKFADHDIGKGKGKGGGWEARWTPKTPGFDLPLVVRYAGKDGLPGENVYISGLPSPQVDTQSLLNLMVTMGLTVGRIRCLPDIRGMGSSAALVQFSTEVEAAQAIAVLHGQAPQALGAVLEGAALEPGTGLVAAPAAQAAPVTNANQQQALIERIVKGVPSQQQALLARVIKGLLPQPRPQQQLQLTQQPHQAHQPVVPRAAPKGVNYGIEQTSSVGGEAWARRPSDGHALIVQFKGGRGPSDHIHVTGLPPETTAGMLKEMFVSLGLEVKWSKVFPDWTGGASAALVELSSKEEAAAAIAAWHGFDPYLSPIFTSMSEGGAEAQSAQMLA